MKPRVLHIIDSFEQGGTERQALQLVRLLKLNGSYEVFLACLQNRGMLRADADRLHLGEIREYSLTSFYDRNFLTQVRRLSRFLRTHQIDVIHTHDFYTNIFGMIAAALAHVPARIASKRETEGFRSAMQKRVERYAYRLAHRVVANSEAVRQQLINEGVPPAKIVTIYNGIAVERITPELGRTRNDLLAGLDLPVEMARRFVTIVANVQHRVKDHPTFLRAAARVKARVPDAAFVIAGEGELLESLRQLAIDLGVGDEAHFIGRCEKVADLLAISEVCVLSSKAEGFSNSILEYMAAGKPVVVTDVGGAREAVVDGQTGYIVSPGDDEAMAEGITQLLCFPSRAREMGEKGQLITQENFSCAAQLEKTLGLYNRLTAAPVAEAHATGETLGRERA